MTNAHEFHEAANIFPLDEKHIADLAKDIRKNGQVQPIELLGGRIIDGRRRFLACQRAKVEPKFREVEADDPVAYVLSLNKHRRHLTPSQLAMVADKARKLYEVQAKERQKDHGGTAPGKTKNTCGKFTTSDSDAGRSRDLVGKSLGVSGKLVDYARRVIERGIPELAKAVEEGRMAVSTAAILATEPEERQREEVNNPKRKRTYRPTSGGGYSAEEEESPPSDNGRPPKGVLLANEAINCLTRIPKNDALRKRGFQLVTDWIKANK